MYQYHQNLVFGFRNLVVCGMVYHLNSGIGTGLLQNSSYTTPIVPEIPVIEAQNNRGFWLPVTVVVISRPLIPGIVHDSS
jgi:hypothetical protein